MVELSACIVQVDGVDQLCIAGEVLLVVLEHGQVLQDVVLDSRDVLIAHPVLSGGAGKALQRVREVALESLKDIIVFRLGRKCHALRFVVR